MDNTPFSLIIPVQSDEPALPLVVQEALAILPGQFPDFEIILADDSSDGVLQTATRLATAHEPVAVVRPRVRGYGAALIHAFRAARGDYLLVMDADRRLTVSDITRLAPAIGHADIVLGYRALPSHLAPPTATDLLLRLGQWLFDVHARDIGCGVKLFRADLLRALDLKTIGPLIDMEILAKAHLHGAQVREVAITYGPSHHGGERTITGADLWRLWQVMRRYTPPAARPTRRAWRERALLGGALAALLGGAYALRRRR